MDWSLRLATPADAERLAASVREGFDSYRSFAPPDWEPPSYENELALLREGLPQPDVWCMLAEAGGELAGHVAIRPSETWRYGSSGPGLAHFWQLFVKPAWHGSGVARALHDEALREARERGFTAIRLFAAAGQERACRFYEREGWTAEGPPYFLAGFGLPVVEYRRAISISV
jgi:ribosomal protein S18 acetylase RimI-like enzyme